MIYSRKWQTWAREFSETALSLAPTVPFVWVLSGDIAYMTEDYPAALDCFQKAFELAPAGIGWKGQPYSTFLAAALWKMREPVKAEKLFERSLQIDQARLEVGDQTAGPCLDMAMIHALRGEKDEAYRWLEEAIDKGWRYYDIAEKDPSWSNLHNDKRFQQLMAEVKANVDEMRSRVEEMEKEWEQ